MTHSPTDYEKTQFVYCYAWGHAWFPTDTSTWRPQFGTPVVLSCERCGTERRETYGTHTGDLLLRNYDHPAGYLYRRGEAKPTKADFRLLAVRKQRADRKSKVVQKRRLGVVK